MEDIVLNKEKRYKPVSISDNSGPSGPSVGINKNYNEVGNDFDNEDNVMLNNNCAVPIMNDYAASESIGSMSDSNSTVSSRSHVSSLGKADKSARRHKKAGLLWRYDNAVKNSPDTPHINLSMSDSTATIENELAIFEKRINADGATRTMKSGYVFMSNIIETVSKNQKLFSLNLDNWSHKVAIDVETPQYSVLFDKLYEQYGSNLTVNPIVALLGLTVVSAGQVAMANQVSYGRTQFNNEIESDTDSDFSDDLKSLIDQMENNKLETSSIASEDVPLPPVVEEVKPKRGRKKKV